VAEKTSIEWTNSTWTPIRARHIELQDDGSGRERIGWHCEHASPGCVNCYAEGINKRLGTGREFKPAHLIHKNAAGDKRGDVSMFLDEEMLVRPLKWKRPRMIFVCSMTDLFANFVNYEWIDSVFAVMLLSRHTYQVLTKRADRAAHYIRGLHTPAGFERLERAARSIGYTLKFNGHPYLDLPLRNIWLGVSVEDQARADDRRVALKGIAALGWLTWVSYEPALTNVDWTGWEFARWMVSGGESGTKARPSHPDWHRAARDFCAANGIAFNFKQWGAYSPDVSAKGAYLAVNRDGTAHTTTSLAMKFDGDGGPWTGMWKAGKKAAGRLLDGQTHDGFPAALKF